MKCWGGVIGSGSNREKNAIISARLDRGHMSIITRHDDWMRRNGRVEKVRIGIDGMIEI